MNKATINKWLSRHLITTYFFVKNIKSGGKVGIFEKSGKSPPLSTTDIFLSFFTKNTMYKICVREVVEHKMLCFLLFWFEKSDKKSCKVHKNRKKNLANFTMP